MHSIKRYENYKIKGFNGDTSHFIKWSGNRISKDLCVYTRCKDNTAEDYSNLMKELSNKFDRLEFYHEDELRDIYIINPIKLNLEIKEFMRTKI